MQKHEIIWICYSIFQNAVTIIFYLIIHYNFWHIFSIDEQKQDKALNCQNVLKKNFEKKGALGEFEGKFGWILGRNFDKINWFFGIKKL